MSIELCVCVCKSEGVPSHICFIFRVEVSELNVYRIKLFSKVFTEK